MFMPRRSRASRLLAECLVISWLSGCYSYRNLDPASVDFHDQTTGHTIIYLKDGRRLVVSRPEVRGDSIVAVEPGEYPWEVGPSVGVPLARVDSVRARHSETASAVVGLGLGVGAALLTWAWLGPLLSGGYDWN